MPDYDAGPEQDVPPDGSGHARTADSRFASGTQALAPVAPDAEPLLALPPAYGNLLVISTRHAPGRVESSRRRAGTPSTGSASFR